jgi:TusA-related sulfurtransferase
MNMVYAKVELSKMQPGQALELILDDGPQQAPKTDSNGQRQRGHIHNNFKL